MANVSRLPHSHTSFCLFCPIVEMWCGTVVSDMDSKTSSPGPSQHSDSSVVQDSTAAFPQFRSLPTDLRLQIFRIICQVSRVVDVTRGSRDGAFASMSVGKPPNNTFRVCYHTHTVPPVMLSVCSESRKEALQIYETPFSHPGLFINFSLDYLYLRQYQPTTWYFFLQLVQGKRAKVVMDSKVCGQVYNNNREYVKDLSELVLINRKEARHQIWNEPCIQKGAWKLELAPWTDIASYLSTTLQVRMDASLLLAELAGLAEEGGSDNESRVRFPHVQIFQLRMQE
jgi:hypothetical protein